MRELKVVGLDVDGKRIICESDESGEKYILRADDRLRAALRGDRAASSQTQIDVEVPTLLRPKEIQAKIRSGASIEQVAAAAGVDVATGRAVCPSGIAGALPRSRAGNRGAPGACRRSRGPDAAGDGDRRAGGARARSRCHQLGRVAQRGRSLDRAAGLEGRPVGQCRAFPVHPGRARRHRHGGRRPRLRADRSRTSPGRCARCRRSPNSTSKTTGAAVAPEPVEPIEPPEAPKPPRARKGKPPVPAWEDVLLGVRSGGQR